LRGEGQGEGKARHALSGEESGLDKGKTDLFGSGYAGLLILTKINDIGNYLRRHSRESGNPD